MFYKSYIRNSIIKTMTKKRNEKWQIVVDRQRMEKKKNERIKNKYIRKICLDTFCRIPWLFARKCSNYLVSYIFSIDEKNNTVTHRQS